MKGGDKAIIEKFPPKHLTNIRTEQRRKSVKQWRLKEGTKRGSTQNSNDMNDWNRQCLTSPQMTPPWLEESWVGVTTEFISTEVVWERLLREGLSAVRVRYLGDNQDRMKLSQVIEANRESLCNVFEVLKPWGAGKLVGNIIVWVRCRGVLLSMWNVECFQSVVSSVENLVEIDEANLT